MVARRVIITKNSNIDNFAMLRNHPNIKKYWHLPMGYTLFEFYHPVFDKIYDTDPERKSAALNDDVVRAEASGAWLEEKKLLAPFYKGQPKNFQGIQLFFPGRTAFTQFLGKQRIQWLDVKLFEGWETAKQARFRMMLRTINEDTIHELENVIAEWSESSLKQSELRNVSQVVFNGQQAEIECSFAGETSTDAVMALYLLLTESRKLTSVESIERVLDIAAP